MALTITTTTQTQVPRLPFAKIHDAVLGAGFSVSLVFVGETRARTLNRTWRKKEYTPNVLSFLITQNEGEVYLCPAVIAREAARYGHSLRAHTAFLFIHALLHLKGYAHGDTMEKAETRYMKRFGLK